MHQQVELGALAIVIGALVGVVMFVPFVAISYRRRGGLSFWRFVTWASALVYFWAIWTYTLLPLPDPDAIRCTNANLDLFAFVDQVKLAIARPGNAFTDPLVLQLALNVLLFLPLGFFVRVLLGRGVIVTTVIGLALSLVIETTQLTGVWGLYPCAYRVFDVDDLLTNTLGAFLGALLAFAVPKRHRGIARAADADEPDPVTRGRRFIAMFCDLLGALILQFFVSVGVQLVLWLLGERDALRDGAIADQVGGWSTAAVWLVVVLTTGRSIGDLAVELRYTGGRLPVWLARMLRYLGGIGGFILLGLLPDPWSLLAWALAATGAVLLFTTTRGRGLPGVVSGQHLIDARSERIEPGDAVQPVASTDAAG